MAWLSTRPRIEQIYCFTTAALNDCGIAPDGAWIKSWIRDQFGDIQPQPTKEECETVLVGLITSGAKLMGQPDSAKKFEEHPLFHGSSLRSIGRVPVGNANAAP